MKQTASFQMFVARVSGDYVATILADNVDRALESLEKLDPEAYASDLLVMRGHDVEIEVEASNARPTDTGVDRGVDVDFDVTIGDVEFSGEVTLLPYEDGRPGYSSWGVLDDWLDGDTVTRVRKLSDRAFREIVEAILSATQDEAGTVSP